MKVNITTEDQITIDADTSLSILESLERNNIQVEYQCRDGFCGACRCKLLDGEVSYFKNIIAFIGEGEILPCSAKPITDIIIKVQ